MSASQRTINNLIVNVVGYLCFWVIVSTGVLMEFILVPGRERQPNDPSTVLGLGRHDWGDIHFWAAVVFVAAILIHITLHWNWIVGVFQKMLNTRSKAALLAILIIPIVLAFAPLLGPRGYEDDHDHGHVKQSIPLEEQPPNRSP